MAEVRLRWEEALPIVTRELRASAKRRWTHRLRMVVALLGGAQLFLAVMFLPGFTPLSGKTLFYTSSAMAMILCAGAGLLLTADSISREKREGTLGLLFLTRVSSVDVVLGKLAVGFLTGGSVAFAALPFLAFSICMGSVTAGELFAMSGLLLFLLAYSLVLGIFVSALFRKESAVSLAFCALMFLPMLVTPLALMKWRATPFALAAINPVYGVAAMMDETSLFFIRGQIGGTLIFQFLAMGFMLACACWIVPKFVQEAAVARRRIQAAKQWRRVNRRALLDTNPMLWLSQRANHPVLFLYACVALHFIITAVAQMPFEAEVAYVALLVLVPKFLLLWQSSGMMAGERRSGFLEALLTTPMPASEILGGKVRALKRQIAPALVFALLVQWAISMQWWAANSQIPISTTVLFAVMITLIVDAHSIAWIGLWSGLVARDRRRALVRCFFWGVVVPWLPAIFGLGLMQFLFAPSWIDEPVNVVPPSIICANIVSLGLACWAMGRLHDRFRATAMQAWALKAT